MKCWITCPGTRWASSGAEARRSPASASGRLSVPLRTAAFACSRLLLTCQSRFQTPTQDALRVNSQAPLTVNTSLAVALRVAFVLGVTERDSKSASPFPAITSGSRPKETLFEEGCERGGPRPKLSRGAGSRVTSSATAITMGSMPTSTASGTCSSPTWSGLEPGQRWPRRLPATATSG